MSDEQKVPYDGIERREEGTSLEVTGPGGMKAVLKSANSAAVLLVVLAAWFGYIGWQGDVRAAARQAEVLSHIDQVAKQAASAVEAQRLTAIQTLESQKAVMYTLSLSQSERERLNLAKPDFLRAMER